MTPGQSRIQEWRINPVKFAYDNFKIELDGWQKQGLEKVGGPYNPRRKKGFKSCTGAGKSAELAIMGWHRLACFAQIGEHPKGAALSGEGRDNLMTNLWPELAKWQQRSEFLKAAFEWNRERISAKHHPDTWFLAARSYARDADLEAIGRSLSGLHSKFPFILLDEIGDAPVTLAQKAMQIFTGGVVDGLIAGAGNPTSTDGLLYHISVNDTTWDITTITADPDDPNRTTRVDIEHAREQINLYGRDNPWVMSTILGQFPPQGFNALFSIDDVEKSMNGHLRSDQYDWSQKRLGVDVARFGDDATVLCPRQGLRAAPFVIMRNARTQEIAARIQEARRKWEHEIDIVDGSGGYGAGVVDALIQAGFPPIEFYGAGKADDPRYFNRRSECYFRMSEWVKRGGVLPKDAQLKRELVSHTYVLQNGKLRVEEKEQIKKRLGFSPDRADALSQTFALPDMPATVRTPTSDWGQGVVLKDYDPLAG